VDANALLPQERTQLRQRALEARALLSAEKGIAATKLRSWDDVATDLLNVLRKEASGNV